MPRRKMLYATVLALIAAAIAVPTYAQDPYEQIKKAMEAYKKAHPSQHPNTPNPASSPTPAATTPAANSAPAVAADKPLKGVKEAVMGPMLAGPGIAARIYLSEDGSHIGIVTAKGSRQVVLIDGVEGPVFDEIPTIFQGMVQVAVQFSPTGGHSGYLGRRGGDLIAVVDGKEAATVSNAQTGQSYSAAGWKFWFNQDGSHVAYSGLAAQSSWVMIADGVKSASYRAIDFQQTLLKGKRLAYVAQTPDEQWHAVVDGKQGPGYAGISTLSLTPDGTHYAYLAQAAGRQGAVAIVDGVETGQAYKGVADLEQAPDGRVAYVAGTQLADPGAHGGGAAMLVIAGKEYPGSCGNGRNPMCMMFSTRLPGWSTINVPQRHVAWSPDGKGSAFIQANDPNPGVTVMVNGKPMGLSYANAAELRFSPDGRRFAYLGTAVNTGFFQVIDGEEQQASSDVPEFRWSPDGKRYAFQSNHTIIVDGKEMPKPKAQGVTRDSFVWSPDSKHFAYSAQFQFMGESPVVDGEVKPLYIGVFGGTNRVQPAINFPPFLFSPDGNHLAFTGYTYDAQGRGNSKLAAMVDGVRYEAPTPSYNFPTFSPDSKHFATVCTGNFGWAAMVDGKMSPSYEDIVLNNVASARFVSDHEYRFYGVKGGQVYRVTIDLTG